MCARWGGPLAGAHGTDMTRRLRSYRRLQRAVIMLLTGYFVAGMWLAYTRRNEVFPVFSWFLFTRVPTAKMRYKVMVYESDGRVLQDPVFFERAGDHG